MNVVHQSEGLPALPEVKVIRSKGGPKAEGVNVMLIDNALWQTGLRKDKKLLTIEEICGEIAKTVE